VEGVWVSVSFHGGMVGGVQPYEDGHCYV